MEKDQKRLNEIVGILSQLGRGNAISGKALFADIPALKEELTTLQSSLSGGEFVPFDFSTLIAELLKVKGVIGTIKDDVEPLIDEFVVLGERNWFQKLIGDALNFKDTLGIAFGNVRDQIFDFDSALNSVVAGSVDAMVQGFSDMMTGAKSFGDAMKDMAKSVIDSLIKMYIKYMIVQPLFDMMFPGQRANSSVIAPKALGGPVQSSTPYLVGERGPELFVPNAGGNIIPNNKMGGGGSGGVTVNQTINITTGIQSTVRAEIINLLPAISKASQNGVADARLRGGNFSRAMGGA